MEDGNTSSMPASAWIIVSITFAFSSRIVAALHIATARQGSIMPLQPSRKASQISFGFRPQITPESTPMMMKSAEISFI